MNDPERLVSKVQELISRIAEANGPQVRSSEWAALCLNTAKRYNPAVAQLVDDGVLNLAPVGHVHDHSEGDLCKWRGWNVGMAKREDLAMLMDALPDPEGAQKIRAGRPGRLQVVIIDGREGEIISLTLEKWQSIVSHVASHAFDLLAPNPCKPPNLC